MQASAADHGRGQRPFHRLGHPQVLAGQGATIAFTYQGDAQAKRLKPLAESLGSTIVLPADVENDEQLDGGFRRAEEAMGGLDFLVHFPGPSPMQGN